MSEYEVGQIRADSGLFWDKGNQVFDARHRDFEGGARGDGVHDDTAALQAWLDASKNRVAYLPSGIYKISDTLTLDPAASYYIYGDAYDAAAVLSSRIRNDGDGDLLSYDNSAGVANDNPVVIEDLTLIGTQNSARGFYGNNIHGLKWIRTVAVNHGEEGVYLIDGWGCKFKDPTMVHNGRSGLRLEKRCNNVTISGGNINNNCRSTTDAQGNLYLTGSAGFENLGVSVTGVHLSGAGQNPYDTAPDTAYGIIAQHTWGLEISGGTYVEGALTSLLYGDSTLFGLDLTGSSYWQDGQVYLNNVGSAAIGSGMVLNVGASATSLKIDGTDGVVVFCGTPTYKNGATKTFAGTGLFEGSQLTGTATFNPADLADGAGETTTITVTGAALGDVVAGVSFSLDLQGVTLTGYVSAADTVSVRFQNETGSSVNLAEGTLRAIVTKVAA